MARFPFNVFLFHTYVAIFKINSFCQTYLSNPSGLQLSVMISDQRYKPEASSTWPLYDPFMQRQPGENLKQIKVTLEFFRRILISVFSSRLSLHSRLFLHNLTLSLKAAESSMLVTTWSQIRNQNHQIECEISREAQSVRNPCEEGGEEGFRQVEVPPHIPVFPCLTIRQIHAYCRNTQWHWNTE